MSKNRKINDIRKYFNQATGNEFLIPELRVSRQVLDLHLLKYAIKEKGLDEPDILASIEVCINGFIWLYLNGGTHATLPSIITEDGYAKNHYDTFCGAWDTLQEYMRSNMDLMDM